MRAQARDITVAILGKTLLSVPLSTHEYKQVAKNCWVNLTECSGVTCDGPASHPGGVTAAHDLRIFLLFYQHPAWFISLFNPLINFGCDFIGYFMSRGKNPRDSYQTITPAGGNFCPLIVSVEEKHSWHKSFNFSILLFYMEGNPTRFVESSDGYINKLVANTAAENTKKSTKYAVVGFIAI